MGYAPVTAYDATRTATRCLSFMSRSCERRGAIWTCARVRSCCALLFSQAGPRATIMRAAPTARITGADRVQRRRPRSDRLVPHRAREREDDAARLRPVPGEAQRSEREEPPPPAPGRRDRRRGLEPRTHRPRGTAAVP